MSHLLCRIAEAHREALAAFRLRNAAEMNQEAYYSATPGKEQGSNILRAWPMRGAGTETRPYRSDSRPTEDAYIEMQVLQGTKGAVKRRRKKRSVKPIVERTMKTRMMCANSAGISREGACNNPNLVEVTGDDLTRPVHCEVDPDGLLGQHVSTF